MKTAASTDETRAGTKKHLPVFLAVFAVFLIATVICAVGACLGVLSARPSHHDTQWFWASGHLLVHGQNPYDRKAVQRIETSVGLPVSNNYVPITLNPPYALFVMAPLGFLNAREGVLAWSLLLVVCLGFSVQEILAMFGHSGERGFKWLAWCFAPAICCIEVGQTGIFLLLGLVLFLRFERNWPFWAGAALSLCAIKPHLFLPFGVVLLLWVIARKRWWIFSGAAAALAVESGIAMLFDHAIWSHYRAMMRTEQFVDYFIPTLGAALRFLVDRAALWVQFVPAGAGCVWGIWYFWRNKERWDWRTHGSLLTLVSLVAAPYAWFTDQVIAIPAILFVLLGARRPRRGSLTLLLAVMSAGAIEMMMTSTLFYKPYLWEGVAWLAWYVYATSGAVPVDDALAGG